jgi:hypothetical protein
MRRMRSMRAMISWIGAGKIILAGKNMTSVSESQRV